MQKTICELFAGVGGFRLGFDRLGSGWETTWFSQWEPGAKTQWAHECYVKHFGDSPDLNNEFHTHEDISLMDKQAIPDHTLLVGGFPCQDYSVAHTLASAHGIEGKKGVLWWQIRDTIIAKEPPFCLLENVDRLLKSPAKQRGRDFGVILACLAAEGYSVEWRVVNAAQYGAAQRRRRTFIFAYRNDTVYGKRMADAVADELIKTQGFMAKAFPIQDMGQIVETTISKDIVDVSDNFAFAFENAGYMHNGIICTTKIIEAEEKPTLLGNILQRNVDEKHYIPGDKMAKWTYLKGAKKIPRKSANGHEYMFSEGPIAFPDPWDRPSRTMLTSESTLNRSTHVVSDPGTGRLRLLTPVEAERLQGFDDEWTNTGMPDRMRYFCMGNALVVPMITRMGKILDEIISNEEYATCILEIPFYREEEIYMPEHVYEKADLIQRFDAILGKTLEEIDNKGLFTHVREFNLQKGVVGTLIEQCVLGYDPDSKQEADLVVVDGGEQVKTELKSTGMVINTEPTDHFVAKEPMSITAVGVYDIAEQEFWTSHFWNKLEHMLLVYYLYASDHPVKPYEYRSFPVKGYEFHEFDEDETEALKQDWEHVRDLAERVTSHHPGPRTKEWKDSVKREYIDVHGELRRVLSYIDLAPKFPPRFRLKKPVVSSLIAKHFGYQLEQLPGRYTVISDIDRKCRELTEQYKGQTINQLARQFGISVETSRGEDKSISEKIAIAMFGGASKKLNQIELFSRFGLIAKSIVITPTGGRTEDMKLFHIDFEEMVRSTVTEEDGTVRPIVFEDSELYVYFADHEFLCIIFEEARSSVVEESPGFFVEIPHKLGDNKFIGFKRLVFSDQFIEEVVKPVWEDTRNKVLNGTLEDIVQRKRDGSIVVNKSGDISSAPNFIKSKDNDVFIRGSGKDSSLRYKTECANGIQMLPQYVWIKGAAVIDELRNTPEL